MDFARIFSGKLRRAQNWFLINYINLFMSKFTFKCMKHFLYYDIEANIMQRILANTNV